MRDRARSAAVIVGVVALVVLVLALGAANPRRSAPVGTDRLGPDGGEAVAAYLDRAHASLSADDDPVRWALVSFDTEVAAADAYRLAGGVRISQVLLGSDYPFGTSADGVRGLNEYGLKPEDLGAIYRGNAERLLPRFALATAAR